jgi:hypothetical protein
MNAPFQRELAPFLQPPHWSRSAEDFMADLADEISNQLREEVARHLAAINACEELSDCDKLSCYEDVALRLVKILVAGIPSRHRQEWFLRFVRK